MSAVRSLYAFLRWRLVPVRYAGKLKALPGQLGTFVPRTHRVETLERIGHDAGPSLPTEDLAQALAIYQPRCAEVVPKPGGHPFTNLMRPEDLQPDNPVFRFALSPQVLDVAHDYFTGRFILDSIQVLYSWPTDGELRESQKWHKDYGDSRSLHCVAYLSDVTAPEHGPFVFVDKQETRRIRRAPFIRRIDDEAFKGELGSDQFRRFYGRAGESTFVDPSACYHYGSRCQRPRLAIFVTFNTDRPFVPPIDLIRDHRERILASAHQVRPDLSDTYLRHLLQL